MFPSRHEVRLLSQSNCARDVATARKALLEARSVALVGYSLPTADLVISGLIAETLSRNAVPIEIVNVRPDPVKGRLELLGLGANSIRIENSGQDAVEQFVRRYSYRAALDMSSAMKAFLDASDGTSEPLLIAWSTEAAAAVIEIRTRSDVIELHAEPITAIERATRRREDTEPNLCVMGDLERSLRPGAPLVVVFPTGRRLNLVGAEIAKTVSGHRTTWQVLSPAGNSTTSV